MLNTLIVGASGYAGAELTAYLNRHPHMNITGLAVSAQSADAGKITFRSASTVKRHS